tara:strand:- start:906 stop:2147 length:1242 start_codon:yes stop_codon:yes gene_type:complete
MAQGDRSSALQTQFKKSVAKARSKGIDSRTNKPTRTNQEKKTGRDRAASGDAARDDEANRRVVVPADKYGLEALLDNKDKLVNIPANDGSGRNMYQIEMEKIKSTPGGLAAFKEKYPNPFIKMAKGIGEFFEKGTVLGRLLSGLKEKGEGILGAGQDKLLDIIKGEREDLNELAQKKANEQAMNWWKKNQAGIMGYKDNIRLLQEKNLRNQLASGFQEPTRVTVEDLFESEGSDPNIAVGESFASNPNRYIEDPITNSEEQINDTLINADLIGGKTLGSQIEDVSETDYNTTELKNQIMNNPGTTTFGAVPGKNFNVFNPEAYLAENPITQDMIETGIIENLPVEQANGGYMRSFPNQNLNTQSLSASDNIDDRIMKNLQFEQMAPGMMGYAGGGKPMSTYQKLKAIADSHYG